MLTIRGRSTDKAFVIDMANYLRRLVSFNYFERLEVLGRLYRIH